MKPIERRRLPRPNTSAALAGAMILVLAIGTVARASSPTLLVHAPVVLALFDGRTASLLVLRDRLDLVTFLIATSIGMSLGDPIAFALGRKYGDKGLGLLSRWMPTTGFVAKRLERYFHSSHGAPLVLTSGYASCALAGAAGVSWPAFAIFNLGSVVLRLVLLLAVSSRFSSFLDGVGDWIAEHSGPLTAMTALLALADFGIGRAKARSPRRRPAQNTTCKTEPDN